MEKDASFILLILAGIILLVLFIYSFKTRVSSRSPHTPELGSLDGLIDEDSNILTSEPLESVHATSSTEPQNTPATEQHFSPDSTPSDFTPSTLFVLHVFPQEGGKFVGYELFQAILAANLRFGKMSIFHRHEQTIGEGKILFSLAQAHEPGTFSMESIGNCECDGLTLFMQLTGPEHNLKTMDLFIQTAQQLADALKGILVDKNKQALTAELKKQFQASVQFHLHSVGAHA